MRHPDGSGGSGADVFRLKGLPAFWAAETITEFGVWVTTIALQVFVLLTLGGTAIDVGWVNAARWAPYLVFGIVLGAVMERWRRRPVMVWTDLGRFVVLAAIPALWLAEWLSLPVLFGVVAVLGMLSLMNDSASQSFVPRLVPAGSLLPAHARLDQGAAVAQTSGPLLAGALVQWLAAPLTIVVSAVTYLVSAVAVGSIRVDEPRAAGRIRMRGIARDVREGLAWVYRHRMLGPMVVSTHAWFFFTSMLVTVFAPFVLLELELDALALGIALAGAGVGGLLGALISTRLGRRFGAGPVVIGCRLLMPLAWAAVALPVDQGFALVLITLAQFVVGLAMGAENANEMGYQQVMTPDAMQARMNTTRRSLNRGMIVIGAPLGGLLAVWLGYRPAIAIAVAGLLVAAVILWISPFRRARHAAS